MIKLCVGISKIYPALERALSFRETFWTERLQSIRVILFSLYLTYLLSTLKQDVRMKLMPEVEQVTSHC